MTQQTLSEHEIIVTFLALALLLVGAYLCGKLMEAIKAHRVPANISGYDSDLYNRELKGWYKDGRTSFTQTASRRREILWMNFEPAAQMELFLEGTR